LAGTHSFAVRAGLAKKEKIRKNKEHRGDVFKKNLRNKKIKKDSNSEKYKYVI